MSVPSRLSIGSLWWPDGKPRRRRPRSQPPTIWPVVGLAVLAALVSMWATSQGPGISVDSVYYASAGHSWALTGRLTQFDGSPMTMWPPGLPLVLGVVERVGVDPQLWTRASNAVLVAFCVILTYVLSRMVMASVRASILAALIVASSAGTTRVFSMLWSEPLFTALALMALVLLTRSVRTGTTTLARAVGVATLTSLATTIRFNGVALIATAMVVAALTGPPSRGGRLLRSVALGLACSSGLIVVAGRNLMLGSGPLGDRTGGGASLLRVLAQGVRALGRYVIPLETKTLVVNALTVCLGLVLVVLVAFGLWHVIRSRMRVALPVGVFTVVWWLVLVYGGTMTTLNSLDDRLTAPVFTSTLLVLMLGVRRLRARLSRNTLATRGLGIVVGLLAVTAVVAGVLASVNYAVGASREGIGFNSVASTRSALAEAVAELPDDSSIASNDVFRAAWLSRQVGIRQASVHDVPAGTAYLVWFSGHGEPWSDVRTAARGMSAVPTLSDGQGTLFRIDKVG